MSPFLIISSSCSPWLLRNLLINSYCTALHGPHKPMATITTWDLPNLETPQAKS